MCFWWHKYYVCFASSFELLKQLHFRYFSLTSSFFFTLRFVLCVEVVCPDVRCSVQYNALQRCTMQEIGNSKLFANKSTARIQ